MPANAKPIIGINCDYRDYKKPHGYVNLNYCDAVTHAGGIPILLPFIQEAKEINQVIDVLDGIIFSGCDDVHPREFRQKVTAPLTIIPEVKVHSDKMFIQTAFEKKLPIFGICGGMQLINIHLGGDLIQDISLTLKTDIVHKNPIEGEFANHNINISENSKLATITQKRKMSVNSFHHQAIGTLGQDLIASAYASDRIVEAIELDRSDHFCIGVQWHPEYLTSLNEHLSLFKALVQNC